MAKHKIGRPSVAETVYGDNAASFEAIWDGHNFKTKRSTADYIYCTTALRIIKEAASDIPYVETICRINTKEPWFSRSILSQLGRMSVQNEYPDANVVEIAKIAAKLRHENYKVKQVEHFIRTGRTTNEWERSLIEVLVQDAE